VLRAVADTHAVIWYIFGDARLSATARNTIEQIAAEGNQVEIAVEIKSFLSESQVTELERAVGQYGIYQELLQIQEADRELYLAVPLDAFKNIFSRQVGKIAIRKFDLKLIVFSFSEEEKLSWIVP
jgi:hypothetical protein